MLRLKRIEVEGFGPFADRQVVELPAHNGVTVIYGENMRGKTSLLNAIRYAFFGTVLGRGSRERKLHTLSNRDRAAEGVFGFSVALTFDYDGQEHQLVRRCVPKVAKPAGDEDYLHDVLLRRGSAALGPHERDHALQQIFPGEVSRFFLFDGELLQEYEELLINESDAGQRISEAIERILGVPILKRARLHLTMLADAADRQAAKEASRHQETEAIGNALQAATAQKDAHQAEIARYNEQLRDVVKKKNEVEQYLQSVPKYTALLAQIDDATQRLDVAAQKERRARGDLQTAMVDAWRGVLRHTVRAARMAAEHEAQQAHLHLVGSLRAAALEKGSCDVCTQALGEDARERIAAASGAGTGSVHDAVAAMARVAQLSKFEDADNSALVKQLWKTIQDAQFEQANLKDQITDWNAALTEADPETIRRNRVTHSDLIEKLTVIKRSIEEQTKKVETGDQSIHLLRKKLEAAGTSDLKATQRRAKVLRDAAGVFDAAVERYKAELRAKVEATATKLFRSMTTEKEDYAGLHINESYGLTIVHRDGRAEEARSAGAEHVVALALMGALQNNAPLRGPIVMDSPFGRLDEGHTSNVVSALPEMAEQVVLLVYESEVGRSQMREFLGSRLMSEYELQRVSARRTNIIPVR